MRPEERDFWPHVTVARVRNGGSADRAGRQRVDVPSGNLADEAQISPFDAVRI